MFANISFSIPYNNWNLKAVVEDEDNIPVFEGDERIFKKRVEIYFAEAWQLAKKTVPAVPPCKSYCCMCAE